MAQEAVADMTFLIIFGAVFLALVAHDVLEWWGRQ